MSSIPIQLSYGLSRLQGFSSTTQRILPLSTQTFNPTQVAVFRLPVNSTVDLHSLALHFTATTSTGVLPAQASELIGRLEVLINGATVFGSALLEYNSLSKLFHNLVLGQDKIQEQAVYSTGTPPATLVYASGNSATATSGAVNLIVDNWVGFLGGSYQRYLDTSILGAVEIRITWAPNAVITPVSAGVGAQTFTITNTELLVETIAFSDNWFQRSLQAALSSAPLLIPFKGYAQFNYYSAAGTGNLNASYAAESLDAIYAFLRPSDYASTTATSSLANVSDGHYFHYSSDTAVHQVRVNNALLPQFPATTQECYTLMKNAVNGGGMNLGYVNVIGSQAVWNSGKFAFVQSLRYKDDSPLSKVASGLNTNQSQIPVSWNFSGASAAPYAPTMIFETTSFLEIGAAQNIMLHI